MKRVIRILLFMVSICGLILICILQIDNCTAHAYSLDSEIEVIVKGSKAKKVNIKLYDSAYTLVDENNYQGFLNMNYKFENGKHGERYRIIVKDMAEHVVVLDQELLFLDYSKLPRLPLLIMSTASGEDPRAEYVENGPSGTLMNTEYEKVAIDKFSGEKCVFSDKALIKCRGNTSGAKEKKSYKLKFNSGVDLLDTGNLLNEWILLNTGYNLNTYIGYNVAKALESEWPLNIGYVNLIINGDWKGVYCLSEGVEYQNSKKLIKEKGGILLEEDSYWWAENNYFRTKRENDYTAYTIKYPNNYDDYKKNQLQSYIQVIEDKIYEEGESYLSYIDEYSFAKWLLEKELMGNYDAYGSNIYFTINDFERPLLDKQKELRIGPGWDYDGSFPDWRKYQSSVNKNEELAMIAPLMQHQSFVDILIKVWEEYHTDIDDEITTSLDWLESNYGDDLEESFRLENARWSTDRESFYKQLEYADKWIDRRVKWLDGNLLGYNISNFRIIHTEICKDYSVTEQETGQYYYWGWAYHDKMGRIMSYDSPYVVALIDGDKVYFQETYERDDVKEINNLDNSLVGFFGTNACATCEISIVDLENMVIYVE